jgi:hypothetical protein
MPFQNRVTPLGELIATPERGLVYGNRGRLHDEHGVIRRQWQVKRWISCRLEFRGRHRPGGSMAPNRYTGLFFLDEATALAAGHRPCFECRRAEAETFATLWSKLHGRLARAQAGEMDAVLHGERVGPDRAKVTFRARLADIPSGAFVRYTAGNPRTRPYLVEGNTLLSWGPGAYGGVVAPTSVSQELEVLTPRSIVAVLSAGYRPMLHPSAGALLGGRA